MISLDLFSPGKGLEEQKEEKHLKQERISQKERKKTGEKPEKKTKDRNKGKN